MCLAAIIIKAVRYRSMQIVSRMLMRLCKLDKLSAFKDIIKNSKNAVFFGGAGVSTASGIPDFRSADGVFTANAALRPEEIVSERFFYGNPEKFYEFYKNKMLYPDAKPNAAHLKLAEWEKEGLLRAVVTQNIDGLHQRAGSDNVLELHGSALRNYCLNCGEFYPLEYIVNADKIPRCEKCGGIVKPDVVLYGEQLNEEILQETFKVISECDVLIVGGTGLAVYPAASFVYAFRGQHLIVVNKSPTGADAQADLLFSEDIAALFASM